MTLDNESWTCPDYITHVGEDVSSKHTQVGRVANAPRWGYYQYVCTPVSYCRTGLMSASACLHSTSQPSEAIFSLARSCLTAPNNNTRGQSDRMKTNTATSRRILMSQSSWESLISRQSGIYAVMRLDEDLCTLPLCVLISSVHMFELMANK